MSFLNKTPQLDYLLHQPGNSAAQLESLIYWTCQRNFIIRYAENGVGAALSQKAEQV